MTGRTANAMRRALVTGGSGGIGAAICRALAADGVHVIVHANRGIERATALANELVGAGGSAQAVAFDVSDAQQVDRALQDLLAAAPIQIVVNNAGLHRDALMAGMSAVDWLDVVDINLNGFFRVTQPLLLPMVRTRWGRVITITSVCGQTGHRRAAT
jgi:3-oxoacyl-[acyl-carrier protein] reductase